jgi:hypothetical protein
MIFENLFEDKITPRCERKYICSGLLLSEVLRFVKLNPVCFSTAYPPRRVSNVYFDTDSYKNLSDAVSGVCERLKIRWRWYNAFLPNKALQLEIKFKKGNLVFKKVYKLQMGKKISFADILENKLLKKLDFLAGALLKTMRPAVFNSYERRYLLSADHKIRLTIDTNLVSKRIYSAGQNLLPFFETKHDKTIVELKYVPGWEEKVCKVFENLPFLISKNSKYVNAFYSPFSKI